MTTLDKNTTRLIRAAGWSAACQLKPRTSPYEGNPAQAAEHAAWLAGYDARTGGRQPSTPTAVIHRCGAIRSTNGQPCMARVPAAGAMCLDHAIRLPGETYQPAEAQRCGWRGKSGRRRPCRAYVKHGTDRCHHHQPELLAEQDEWRAKDKAMQRLLAQPLPHSPVEAPRPQPAPAMLPRAGDWLATLRRSGDGRSLAAWLTQHHAWLADSMAAFALDMVESKSEPSLRQLALLISLRGGVEALQRWDAIEAAAEQLDAMGPAEAIPSEDADGHRTSMVLH